MSNTVTQYLTPSHWTSRRSSLCSLSEAKINRQRSNSSGAFVVVEQKQNVRSPSTYNQRRFSYSGIHNFGTNSTVIRGNSPSVIECADEDTRKRKLFSIPVFILLTILLVLAILGILGVIASKTLPKPNSYCLGEHFCVPVRASKEMVTKLNLSAIKERANAEASMQAKLKDVNVKKRVLFPRLIPRVIGKMEATNDYIVSNERFDKPGIVLRKSPFMHREADAGSQGMQREWHDQWDNRRFATPPGVNPKIYWKNEL